MCGLIRLGGSEWQAGVPPHQLLQLGCKIRRQSPAGTVSLDDGQHRLSHLWFARCGVGYAAPGLIRSERPCQKLFERAAKLAHGLATLAPATPRLFTQRMRTSTQKFTC